ncbi:MAG: AMP-binding protein [Polaribacter sp.]|nr:AMP-binding protein [Polaribacter sp.]
MKNSRVHKNFQLNEKSFSSVAELLVFSKTISETVFLFLSDWFSDDDFIKVTTSGSTGKPTVITLKKEFMKNSALATGAFFDLKENTTALLCLPVAYIAGKMMLVRALVLGWHLDVVAPTSEPLKGIEKTYDFSAMVPMQLQNSVEELHTIKKLIVGGGVVTKIVEAQLQSLKTEIFATYGMTETITHIAVRKLNNFRHAETTSVSHYKTLSNITISQDDRNCLVINAPKISDTQIITNDIVRIISNIEFDWLGRFDNVINSGAVKLHPEQIEEKLSAIISQRFFVAGVPDSLLGEKLVLLIEGPIEKTSIDKIKSLKTLSGFEIPKEIYFINEFIETKTKKIQRKKTLDIWIEHLNNMNDIVS